MIRGLFGKKALAERSLFILAFKKPRALNFRQCTTTYCPIKVIEVTGTYQHSFNRICVCHIILLKYGFITHNYQLYQLYNTKSICFCVLLIAFVNVTYLGNICLFRSKCKILETDYPRQNTNFSHWWGINALDRAVVRYKWMICNDVIQTFVLVFNTQTWNSTE